MEQIRHLITAMTNKNAIDTQAIFNGIVSDKITNIVNDMKQETAKTMFSGITDTNTGE